MSLSPGTKLGHYELLSPLGSGGMGQVYKARDLRLHRDVALKLLPDHLASDSDARERFEREAKTVATLSHPNIMTIHDFGDEDGVEYAVMELLEGETLEATLSREGALPWRRVLEMGTSIARGLAAAHEKGIVHRDIKPSNLFVSEDGNVKILDFGLAKSFTLGLSDGRDTGRDLIASTSDGMPTVPGTVLGTIGYMSPEQAKGQSATAASDVFSLSCVLYEMVSGKMPFEGATPTETVAAIMKDEPPSLRESGMEVPGQFAKIILKALQKEPDARHSNGKELLTELDAFHETLGTPVDIKATARFFKTPLGAVAALLTVAVIAALVISSTTRQSREDWARETAIPEIMQLIEDQKFIEAFRLATEAARHVPDDPVLTQLWPRMTSKVSIRTTPSGAEVYYKEYSDLDGEWEHLGQTSIEGIDLP